MTFSFRLLFSSFFKTLLTLYWDPLPSLCRKANSFFPLRSCWHPCVNHCLWVQLNRSNWHVRRKIDKRPVREIRPKGYIFPLGLTWFIQVLGWILHVLMSWLRSKTMFSTWLQIAAVPQPVLTSQLPSSLLQLASCSHGAEVSSCCVDAKTLRSFVSTEDPLLCPSAPETDVMCSDMRSLRRAQEMK